MDDYHSSDNPICRDRYWNDNDSQPRRSDTSRSIEHDELTVKNKAVTHKSVGGTANKKTDKKVTLADISTIADTYNPPVQIVQAPSGTCAEWMTEAGIDDIANATALLNTESHCNPNAVNPTSGACGLEQALPCSKAGCALGDGLCQMKWFKSYVLARYGSFAAAMAFHLVNNWY